MTETLLKSDYLEVKVLGQSVKKIKQLGSCNVNPLSKDDGRKLKTTTETQHGGLGCSALECSIWAVYVSDLGE